MKKHFYILTVFFCLILISMDSSSAHIVDHRTQDSFSKSKNFLTIEEELSNRKKQDLRKKQYSKVKEFVLEKQLEIVNLFDEYFSLRDELNTFVTPQKIGRPPNNIIQREKVAELKGLLFELQKETIDLYLKMERQLYDWEASGLVSKYIREKAETSTLRFRKELKTLWEHEQAYLEDYDKLVLFLETDYRSYYIISGQLHFVSAEALGYFETLQERLERTSQLQKATLTQIRGIVKSAQYSARQ